MSGIPQNPQYPNLIPLAGGSDLYMQVGRSLFNGIYTDATDMPVVSPLTQVTMGMAVVDDTYSPATDANGLNYQLHVNVVPASGAISVFRSSQGMVSSLPFSYIFIGKVFSSD
jgi:hypothetical protein